MGCPLGASLFPMVSEKTATDHHFPGPFIPLNKWTPYRSQGSYVASIIYLNEIWNKESSDIQGEIDA